MIRASGPAVLLPAIVVSLLASPLASSLVWAAPQGPVASPVPAPASASAPAAAPPVAPASAVAPTSAPEAPKAEPTQAAAPPTPEAPKAEPVKPAPAAEPAPESTATEKISEELRVSRQGLGLNPGALQYGGLVVPPNGPVSPAVTLKPGQINFHGFLRVPIMVGFGNGAGLPTGYTGLKLHSPPYIPDSAYTEWQYTNQLGGPWTELMFSYGDARVSANVMIAAYNLSDSSWKDLSAQLGINEAWLTFNFPEFFGPKGGFIWNVGSFHGGYGSAGRYDAGEYETYLFGRTHTAGETLSVFYDLNKDFTLQVEHGFGVRLDVQEFQPNSLNLSYLPYAGPVQQLPTLLHHAHVGFTYKDRFTLAAHYLNSFTHASPGPTEPDGHITSMGIGAKLNNSRYGSAFLGYAHIDALNALRVGGAIEVLHSWEGWSLAQNFWGPSSPGNGKVDSVAWQYTFSLSTFLQGTDQFYGQGVDLLASVFGMYNVVTANDPNDPTFINGKKKLKFGGDVTYLPLYWLGLSTRLDLVQPDLDNSHKSFSVVSPRVLLRTSFVSHEEIYFQYSHYFNGSQVQLAFPSTGMSAVPDKDVASIIANMYW